MTDNVIPFPISVNQGQPEQRIEKKKPAKKVDARIGLAYGYCPPPADSEHVPWTEVVLGQGGSDWTR